MKKSIARFLWFQKRFGVIDGLKLFINFKLNKLDEIKVPDFKSSILLRPGTSDIAVFNYILLYGGYEINFTEEPKVIIDGGANIGLFSILLKNKYPKAKIICIEPDIENYQVLTKNLKEYSDVYFENAGLWSKEAVLKSYDKYGKGKEAVIVEENAEGDTQAISINTLIDKYNLDKIDILKLDIETSEKELFSENFERWLPKTKMIIIELHDTIREGCSKTFFEAINKTFNKYEYSTHGESTIIINKDL